MTGEGAGEIVGLPGEIEPVMALNVETGTGEGLLQGGVECGGFVGFIDGLDDGGEIGGVLCEHGGPAAAHGAACGGIRVGAHGVVEAPAFEIEAGSKEEGVVLQIVNEREHGL